MSSPVARGQIPADGFSMMKNETKDQARKNSKENTQPPGQNPKAKDSPEFDEHHDESRRNAFDEEVAEALKGKNHSG